MKTAKIRAATVVLMLCVGTLLFAVFGCQGPGGATTAGVVASVTVGDAGERPKLLVRYDANAFVAWGGESYVSEVYIQATGMPLYLQFGKKDVAMVKIRKPELSWQGHPGDALPPEVRVLFRQAEIDQWGLTFLNQVPPQP